MRIICCHGAGFRLNAGRALRVAGWIGVLLNFAAPAPAQAPEAEVLARIEVIGPASSFALPVQAFLQDALGRDYFLALSTRSRLERAGWPYRVLDEPARPQDYLLAQARRAGAQAAATGRFALLHDDGVQWLVRATAAEAEALAGLGFAVQRLGQQPLAWRQPGQAFAKGVPAAAGRLAFQPDPLVAAMIQQVRTSDLYWLTSRLTGEEPVVAEGSVRVVASRHTGSATQIQSAVQLVSERLAALGLEVRLHDWSSSGWSGRNVVATQPGGALSNELVLLTAHLDNMPAGARAPGADDNASGCVAVLTAAGICSQHRFERTVRFVLFTGEEQGLLGSKVYAAAAAAAGENIVAVLNLDMIGWDATGEPVANLYTRTPSNPGYSDDLAIAALFTNVVAGYGLGASLKPVILSTGMGYSDHESFWRYGYPAILGMEQYGSDFNVHYHTTNDTLQALNLAYFTAFTRAAVATLAHLARPVGRVRREVIEVVASDWTPGSGVGAGVFYARHDEGAREGSGDPFDLAWSAAPANPNLRWLKLSTQPDGVELKTDARPADSETLFRGRLSAVVPNGAAISGPLRLRFDFLSPPAPERLYTARIQLDGRFLEPAEGFLCVTNLRPLVEAGGYLQLPALAAAGDGAVLGACDLAARFLDTSRTHLRLTLRSAAGPVVILSSTAQVGIRLVDELELATSLQPDTLWTPVAAFTNTVAPDASSFEAGWTELTRTLDASSLLPGPERYFRLKRTAAP